MQYWTDELRVKRLEELNDYYNERETVENKVILSCRFSGLG